MSKSERQLCRRGLNRCETPNAVQRDSLCETDVLFLEARGELSDHGSGPELRPYY